MKNQSVGKTCLISMIGILLLLVTVPVFANSSKSASKPQNFFVKVKQDISYAFKSIGQFFRGSKTKTVQNTKSTKQRIKKDFKNAKTKTVNGTKKAGQNVKKSFKSTKSKAKQDVKTVKQTFKNGFKSLKK